MGSGAWMRTCCCARVAAVEHDLRPSAHAHEGVESGRTTICAPWLTMGFTSAARMSCGPRQRDLPTRVCKQTHVIDDVRPRLAAHKIAWENRYAHGQTRLLPNARDAPSSLPSLSYCAPGVSVTWSPCPATDAIAR